MGGERRYIPASEFCASVRDGTHDSPKPVQNGRKLITSRHLTTGRLDLTDAYLISDGDFEAINKRSKVDRWDVLISMIGTVGESCLIKEEPGFAIKNIGLFKTKTEADGKWLYYFLQSNEAQQSIHEQSRGTTQQYIPLGALREFPILVCDDLEEQKAIVEVLGALDDKIELNRRMNATLEAVARALFQSWFVDFDPVRAKLDGRKPSNLDPTTAALFPDAFQDSALGHIPKGWEISRLDEIATVTMGLSPNGESYNSKEIGTPLINGPVEFGDYFPVKAKWTEAATRFATKDDLIFCVRGSTTGRRVVSDGEYGIGRGVCAIRPNNGCYSFLYQTINIGLDRLLEKTTGSVFPSLNAPDIKGFPVLKPSKAILEAYDRATSPLLRLLQQNHHQSRTLATLRDTLLPKLLSGELRVAEVKSKKNATA